MPKKKTQKNGLYWYMQELLPALRREGRVFPNGMQDVVVVALPRWKSLSDEERERYERMAKEKKKKSTRTGEADQTRLDNQGNVIAYRVDEDLVESKRRARDRKLAQSKWPDAEGILTYPFYLVAFEYLCETEEKEYLPCEMALIEYTLQDGIIREYHKFVQPGGIPMGYRYTCQSHSDERHQIPIENFELADDNYLGMWTQMENFVNQDQRKSEYPPIYTFCGGDSKNWGVSDYCMKWLHVNACTGRPNTLHRIYSLEDMIQDLYEKYNTHGVALSQIQDMLATSAFDYECNTRCEYHEKIDIKYCALATLKRHLYALSDALSSILGFTLTPNHLPVQDDTKPAYSVIPPSAVHLKSAPKQRDGGRSNKGSAYDALVNSGPFGARDIRYMENNDDSSSQSDNGESAHSGAPWGAAPSKPVLPAPGSGPWARTVAAATAPAPPSSQDDFPPLGGGSSKPKFAGRATAPPPTDLPQPGSTWQAPPQTVEAPQRLPNTVPLAAMATRPAATSATGRKSLQQAVAEEQTRKQAAPPVAPPAGRGVRSTGAEPRAVNSGGFNPQRPDSGGFGRNMTLGESVRSQNLETASVMSDAGSTTSQATSMRSMNGLDSSQPLAGLGRGRGRGLYSGGAARQASGGPGMRAPPGGVPHQASGGSGMKAPPGAEPRQAAGGSGMRAPPGATAAGLTRPPPGFGRGMNQHMAKMSLNGEH